jgi:hypothetical protein
MSEHKDRQTADILILRGLGIVQVEPSSLLGLQWQSDILYNPLNFSSKAESLGNVRAIWRELGIS